MRKRLGCKAIRFVFIFVLVNVLFFPFANVNYAQERERPRAQTPGDQEAAQQQEAQKANTLIQKGAKPTPIIIEKTTEELEKRLERMITLDVREMNVIDVLKFLALKGDFNMITSDQVAGRVTLYLKNISIWDTLEIILISNRLAYHIEHDVVHVISEAEYASMYGKKFNDKNVVEIVKLDYAKPSYVLATLENVKSALGRIIIDEDTGTVVMIDNPQSIKAMKDLLKEIEAPFENIVYTVQFAEADVVASKLQNRIDAHAVGSITVDERTNKLIVRALPGRLKEVTELLKSLDAPTKEVLVEARVLQITFRPTYNFGVDWQMDFRNSAYQLLRRTSFKSIMLNESNIASSTNLVTNYGRVAIGDFSVNKFETALRALKQVSSTKVLSNPKLLVTNKEEAKIHVGDTVPYIISTTSGTGDNAITSEDVRFVDVGLKLSVTPIINDDGFVTMTLMPEISTVTATVTSQSGGIPQVNKTLVETTVMVKDGMTVILGGLKKENKVLTRAGIPILMDIPYIKNLFSSTNESIEATEIVIFITPHIITGDKPYNSFEGELKSTEEYEKTGGEAGLSEELELKS